jgi:hypothetical protein
MIAGTIGDAAAAEFLLVVEEIAATVQVADLLEAPKSKRPDLYPQTMTGLTALTYALIGTADAATMPKVIEVRMAPTRNLTNSAPPGVCNSFARNPACAIICASSIASRMFVGTRPCDATLLVVSAFIRLLLRPWRWRRGRG